MFEIAGGILLAMALYWLGALALMWFVERFL